jgi:hypothetical protein
VFDIHEHKFKHKNVKKQYKNTNLHGYTIASKNSRNPARVRIPAICEVKVRSSLAATCARPQSDKSDFAESTASWLRCERQRGYAIDALATVHAGECPCGQVTGEAAQRIEASQAAVDGGRIE